MDISLCSKPAFRLYRNVYFGRLLNRLFLFLGFGASIFCFVAGMTATLTPSSSVIFFQFIPAEFEQKTFPIWECIQNKEAVIAINQKKIVIPVRDSFIPIEIESEGVRWEVAALTTSSLGEMVGEVSLKGRRENRLIILAKDAQNVEYLLLVGPKGEVHLSQLNQKIEEGLADREREMFVEIPSEFCAPNAQVFLLQKRSNDFLF